MSSCTLSGAELEERIARIRSELAPHATARARRAASLVVRFPASLRERLEHLVELERRCCGHLSFELRSDADALALEITSRSGEPAELDAFDLLVS